MSFQHFRGQTRPSLLENLSTVLVALSVIVKLGCIIALRWQDTKAHEYSYIGSDYPEAWPIDRPFVLMAADNSIHFELDSPQAIAEWASLVPGGGLIHLGAERQPYAVSMLHQLRCLDIIRDELVRSDRNVTALGRHCMNYMRQMVLCRGAVQIEAFEVAAWKPPVDLLAVYKCRDWGAVYRAVAANQKEHEEWKREHAHAV